MYSGDQTIAPALADIEHDVAESVCNALDDYMDLHVGTRHIPHHAVSAAIGKALLFTGARFLGQAIGETDYDAVFEPASACLRKYWAMADRKSKEASEAWHETLKR